MPGKRKPSKQRRQAQNRHVREARAVRTERAKQLNRTTAAADDTADAPASSAAPAKARPARVTTAGQPTGVRSLNPFQQRPGDPVGYRAALLAFIFSIAAAVSLLFIPVIPKSNGKGKVVENVTLLHYGWQGLMLALVPVLLTGTVVLTRNSPKKKQSWTISAISLAAYTILSGSLGLVFLAPTIALGVAAYQVRKAEQEASGDAPTRPARAPRERKPKPARVTRSARPTARTED
jgi:hypothetical protein